MEDILFRILLAFLVSGLTSFLLNIFLLKKKFDPSGPDVVKPRQEECIGVEFENVREKILKTLKSPGWKDVVFGDFYLVNAFINIPLAPSAGEICIGGKVVPSVMIVEKKTGKVSYFSYKILKEHCKKKRSS